MSLLFYVAHCPFDEKSQNILQVCIESIQKHHPDSEIIVLYSESRLPCVLKVASPNIQVSLSPIQNSSVIGCFYHYLQSNTEKKAVFLHDSMILRENLEPYIKYDFAFLWDFDGEVYKGLHSIICEDIKGSLATAMNNYPNNPYLGCFGLCVYSDRKSMEKLWNALDFLYYVNHPQRTNAFMDLERVLGFHASLLGLGNPSLCGSIIGSPRCFNRWYENQTLEEIENMGYQTPIIKTWMSRFIRESSNT